MGEALHPDQRPTRVRYAVLAVFCSLAFLTYLDRICIMRVQNDIASDLGFRRLTAEDEERLAAEGKADDATARAELLKTRGKQPMSWIFGAFTLGYLLFEIPGGRLGDRWGPRRVLFRIVVCWSIFTALTGSADTLVRLVVSSPGPMLLVAALVVVRFLFGAFEAGAYPNISRVVGRWFPYRDRGFAQGFIWMSSRSGGAFAPAIIGGLMAAAGGWRHGFWVLGVVGIMWALAFYWWFRDRPEEMPAVNAAEADLIRAGAVQDAGHGTVPWRRLLSSTNLWAIYLCHACICFSAYFFITFIPKFLEEKYRIGFSDSEFLSGSPSMVAAVMCLTGGRLSDLIIRRTGNRRWGRSGVGAAALALAALFCMMVPLANGVAAGVVLLCCIAGAQDLMVPVLWSLPADIGGRHAGTVGGAMNTAGGIGAVLGPVAAAYVAETWGWHVVFPMFAGSYALAAVLWLRIDATEPFEQPTERINP